MAQPSGAGGGQRGRGRGPPSGGVLPSAGGGLPGGTRMAEQYTPHLYLLFDDWHSGFSIRKVRLSRRSGKSSASGNQGGVVPVPEAFMHIQAQRGLPDLLTSAFGTKIMAMHTVMDDDNTEGIPMADVHEQTITFGPQPCTYHSYPICFPIGANKLFVLDTYSFDRYLWTPEHSQEPWGSQALPPPPFDTHNVSSYGVLPDGCILVSTTESFGGAPSRTFIFDTTKEEHVWKPFCNWVLPFTGRGHYDRSLEGFVGLSKDKDGYLCCSTMDATGTSPHVKRTKEKVYTERQHVSATLVHMGEGRFCLVECVSADNRITGQDLMKSCAEGFIMPLVDDEDDDMSDFVGDGPQGGRCMYHLRTFNLSYDPEGDCLKLKSCKGHSRWYSLPHEANFSSVCLAPVAFWL